MEFTRQFATEEQCLDYLVRCRWPGGFRCRRGGGEKSWPRPDRKAMRCAGCDLITTVTAGTAMHRSRLPLVSTLDGVATAMSITVKKRPVHGK